MGEFNLKIEAIIVFCLRLRKSEIKILHLCVSNLTKREIFVNEGHEQIPNYIK